MRASRRASDSSSVRRPDPSGPDLNWSGVRVRYLTRYWQPPATLLTLSSVTGSPSLEHRSVAHRERAEERSSSELICREERQRTARTTLTSASSQSRPPEEIMVIIPNLSNINSPITALTFLSRKASQAVLRARQQVRESFDQSIKTKRNRDVHTIFG